MRHSKHFLLREIGGVPYLMPWGQPIADQRRGMKLNRTSAWLWQLLETERTQEELLELLGSRFAAVWEDMPILKQDLLQFLHTLQFYGMLENEASNAGQTGSFSHTASDSGQAESFCAAPVFAENSCRYLQIGGLNLKLVGPPEIIPAALFPFERKDAKTIHQTIRIHIALPSRTIEGQLLLQNQNLFLYETEQYYRLLFPSMAYIEELLLSKDASWADLCYMPPCPETWKENLLKEDLFHALRFAFVYLALKHHMAVIHSASLLYRGRAWLFSASSGTGKSTHTNLWHELLQVPLLNGDLNLLALDNGQPVIHGLPWCGTSGISDCGTHPLGGIILLKQDRKDFMETLSPDAGQLLVLQRLISPLWTPEHLDCCIRLVDKLSKHIYIARLHCTKNISAVETARTAIDRYCEKSAGKNA